MDIQEYIQQRLDPQIAWYDSKSVWNQEWYKRLRFAEIIIACSLSFLVSYADSLVAIKILAGLLGVAIAVIAGILALFKFQENWIEYRSTCENLEREKLLFETGTEPYDTERAALDLVARAEAILSKEYATWTQRISQQVPGLSKN
jgi:Protein of unknown function (DUF4231)